MHVNHTAIGEQDIEQRSLLLSVVVPGKRNQEIAAAFFSHAGSPIVSRSRGGAGCYSEEIARLFTLALCLTGGYTSLPSMTTP